jgi:hypothetical protein
MKKIYVSILIVLLSLCFTAGFCSGDNKKNEAENKQAVATNQLLNEANRQVGMPNMKNFQLKKIMKLVFEACDQEDLICYAYIKSDYQGKLMFIGKCIGYGVPFSAQYTNPMKIIDPDTLPGQSYYNSEGVPVVIPQADPSGLYPPTSSSATWLLMIDPKTKKPRLVYLEPEIVVSPFPLH